MSELSFLVFSDDWGGHPSSAQHLFRHIGQDHQVLWVNTVGMRAPTVTAADLSKGLRKLRSMFTEQRRQEVSRPPRLHVVQPPMIPLPGSSLARALNRRSVLRVLRAAMAQHGIVRPLAVSSVPNASEVLDDLELSGVVYYCVDDFTRWPGLDHDTVSRMEERLVRQSDVVIAASIELERKFANCGRRVERLEHGVDVEHFGVPAGREHTLVADLQRPRAGFFGLIDERFDVELLAAIAARMPDWTFILAGPIARDVSALESLANIRLIGPVPYADLPMLVAGLDVLLMPYVVSEFTHTLAPLKLNEYLATGRPVVSSDIAGARAAVPWVDLAQGLDEWCQRLRSALGQDRDQRRSRVVPLMRGKLWSDRAEQLFNLCSELSLRRRGALHA